MKPLIVFLVCLLCVAASASDQPPSNTSSAKVPSAGDQCTASAIDQTAWFDSSHYLRRCDGVKFGKPISTLDPEYSVEAQKKKITGKLILAVAVNAQGEIDLVKVVQSLESSLDKNAVDAVRQWKFMPAMKDGTPVAVQFEVEISLSTH
jgi:TonB family protein